MREPQKKGLSPASLYMTRVTKKLTFLFIITAGVFITAFASISMGAARVGFVDSFYAILAGIFPNHFTSPWLPEVIVWEFRLPRIAMSMLAGGGLGMAGAVMQGVLRNPLASPFTLGIASAAGFGAALAIIAGAGIWGTGSYLIVVNAFIFALLAVVLVYNLAVLKSFTPETMVLSGIAIMYLFSSLTSILQYTGASEDVQAVVMWLLGSLSAASWARVRIMATVLFISFPFLLKAAPDFNAMAAGDETASSLGINVKRVRTAGMVFAALITASIVCFTGTIGFVGLVAPHIARMILGGDHKYLLPGSALLGALLLLMADTIARTILAPVEIPVGIMTSFVGVPFFVYLLIRRRRDYWG